MNFDIEEIDSCTRRITFALESDKVDAELRNRIQRISREASIPGFRKGKVPFNMIQKRYGNEVLREVIADLSNQWMDMEMHEHSDSRVGPPVLDGFERNEQTRDYDIRILYEVLPQVVAFDIEGCKVVRPVVNVSDKDVDTEIEKWLKERPQLESVDRPAVLGDRVLAQIEETVHVEGGQKSSDFRRIWLQPDQCEKSILDACLGKSAGERVTADILDDSEHPEGEEAVKVATVNIQIVSVEQPIPDSLNEDMQERLEVESPQDENFHEAAKDALVKSFTGSIDNDVQSQVFSALFKRNPFSMPKFSIRYIMLNQLVERGMKIEDASDFVDHRGNTQEWMMTYFDSALKLKRSFLLEKLRVHYEMPIDDEKIMEAVEDELQTMRGMTDPSDTGESAELQRYRDIVYQRNRWMAEQDNVKSLIDKLLENADYEEVEMTLAEYEEWREDLHSNEQLSDDSISEDIDESEHAEEIPETSVIVDALGNPIEKQSA